MMDKNIAKKKEELRDMQILKTRYLDLIKTEKEILAAFEKREKNFFFSPTLWARLAEKAKIPKENFKQEIKEPSAAGISLYKEISAHLELEGITLEQLIKFIFEIESVDPFFKIKNLNIRRIEKNPGYLKVNFEVVTQVR